MRRSFVSHRLLTAKSRRYHPILGGCAMNTFGKDFKAAFGSVWALMGVLLSAVATLIACNAAGLG
jgi:hypothetical protein